MAAVALQHSDDPYRRPFILSLDSESGTSRAARIAGWTLMTVVVIGIMALWTQPLAHADHLRPSDSSLTLLALPALRPLALGTGSPFDPEPGPTASSLVPMPKTVLAPPAIPPATGDTVTIQNQALSISESFGLHITQEPTA